MKLIVFPPLPRDWVVANPSPFCLKVETYLRMTDRKYELIAQGDPRKAPKGKLPVLEDQGRTIADSGAIIEYLKTTYGDTLDASLGPRDRALAHVMRRMLEEHTYWPLLHERWVHEGAWDKTKSTFFSTMPSVVRMVVPELIRKKMKDSIHAQGVGRHQEREIWELARADFAAASELLGDKPYMLGDQPSSLDAIAYAFLGAIMLVPFNWPLKSMAERFPALTAYTRRMHERYYPERC